MDRALHRKAVVRPTTHCAPTVSYDSNKRELLNDFGPQRPAYFTRSYIATTANAAKLNAHTPFTVDSLMVLSPRSLPNSTADSVNIPKATVEPSITGTSGKVA